MMFFISFSIKTIDLTIEPSTPVQDEVKTPEDVPKVLSLNLFNVYFIIFLL